MNTQELTRRFKLSEEIWFKVLRLTGGKLYSKSGGTKCWRAPSAERPAPWQVEADVEICHRGLHITTDPYEWGAGDRDAKTFVVEVPWLDPKVKVSDQRSDKIAVSKVRLLREAEPLDYLKAGIVNSELTVYDFPTRKVRVRGGGRLIAHGAANAMVEILSGGSCKLNGDNIHVDAEYGADHSEFTGAGFVVWRGNALLYTGGYIQARALSHRSKIHVGVNSVVRVQGSHSSVYAENGSVVIVEAPDCHVRRQSLDGVTVVRNGHELAKTAHLATILDDRGQFAGFIDAPRDLKPGYSIVN